MSLFEFKGDIRNFFPVSYYEIWRKPLTENFILGLLIFVIILILIFFRILGFRGIGNIFLGFCFWASRGLRLGQRFIQVVLQIVVGRRQRSNSIEEFSGPWNCWRPVVANIFRLEFQGWNKGMKSVACFNILWVMSKSFSHDGVLDSCVIWQSETNLGKARFLYIGSHEGSWLNWNATRRGCNQVKHVP